MEHAVKTIGYVLADFPALSETFVGNEMRAMRAEGHRVVPIVMHLLDGPAQEEDRRMIGETLVLKDIPRAAALGALVRPSRRAGAALSFLMAQRSLPRRSLLGNALKIANVARQAGCAHLHAHFAGGAAAHAIVAARWIGATVSFVGHGHDIYSEPQDIAAKLAAVDFAVATCDDMVADFESFQPGVRALRVPCGTDPARFRPVNDDAPRQRFLAIGRLVEQKAYDDLLHALARSLPTVGIDVVGDGPLRDSLKEMAQGLGLGEDRIRWLGPRANAWIVEAGPGYAAFVAPFRMAPNGERDTSPVAIKEAMAMGLPVIGTRFMGTKEMVGPDNGILVEPGDVEGLARALDTVVALDPAKRRAMGEAGRRRVERELSLDAQARRLSSLVEAA